MTNTPNLGGTITLFTIVPQLPAGLSLNPSTGVISGIPTVTSALTVYTVTGSNTGGVITGSVTITVNDGK